ncbi:MAG: ribonuclease HII [Methanobacteriaceae archaeon]|nr:ribonuclease HII [Methanobacteriaceae archaeon]
MNTLGLDEAGRGPVLGPMIMGGIVIPEKKEKIVERMGVKDSKKVTPKRRAVLSRKLTKMFDYELVEISARDIDLMRAKGVNLNQIEKLAMKQIIRKLDSDRIIIDALDVKEGRLQEEMQEYAGENREVLAEHKADENYLAVGAASIIAKHRRDQIIDELNRNYIKTTKDRNGIGSGYPSDPKTKAFLKQYTYDTMPEFVRRSWGTVQKIKEEEETNKLL